MIELTELVKEYPASVLRPAPPVRALAGVTLRVERGTALGVVGLNGAGKSTLLRILLGYAKPTAGEVSIDGLAPRAYAEHHGIAYVPERVTIPRGWTVEGALRAYAMFAGIGDRAWERVRVVLHRVGLDSIAGRRVSALSKGNLQRLAIAQALLAERKLMVLDEPTDGLDPLWVAGLRDMIHEWRSEDPDRVLILASHNLTEVEKLAGRVILLHNGVNRGELPVPSTTRSLEEEFLTRVASLEEARP
jgi:ABC-type multidrug transport system ATPase subunit